MKEVESFLGFVNYYRDHLKEFAKSTSCLYQLTGAKAEFKWDTKHNQAFEFLKQKLTSVPVLAFPNKDDTFVLDTDASDFAIGGVLSQIQNGVEKVVCYGSAVLAPAQRKYCTTRKELLAVVKFCRQFRHYLLGRKFLLRTDHNSLTWLMRFRTIEGQLARWIEELSQYNMEIVHRPGVKHGNADGLSRIPDNVPFCDCYAAGKDILTLPCKGCKFCKRADQQWTKFNSDVDEVIPLAVRSLSLRDNKESSTQLGMGKDQIREEQLKDKDIQQLIHWLETAQEVEESTLIASSPAVKHFWSNKSQLKLEQGILYYAWKEGVDDRLLLMVPQSLKAKVLQGCHDSKLSGHVGLQNTRNNIKQSFIWHGMSRDIQQYVHSCGICARSKKSCKRARAEMRSYHSGAPMERVHMDILGPFTKSSKGNQYILIIIDQFYKVG